MERWEQARLESVRRKIDTIYIQNGYGGIESEYKVDLAQGRLWEFHREIIDPNGEPMDQDNYTVRDKDAENEGFTLLCRLEPERVETFRVNCVYHGLLDWEEEYCQSTICGGTWYLTIRFADGTEKKSWGTLPDREPKSYEDIRQDFQNLTGRGLLEEKDHQ
ncbi:MAG: hypothetical protein HFF13_11725 [Angelakisella sp.]|nr:hypothetical protein [Angelakisella sp.]